MSSIYSQIVESVNSINQFPYSQSVFTSALKNVFHKVSRWIFNLIPPTGSSYLLFHFCIYLQKRIFTVYWLSFWKRFVDTHESLSNAILGREGNNLIIFLARKSAHSWTSSCWKYLKDTSLHLQIFLVTAQIMFLRADIKIHDYNLQ